MSIIHQADPHPGRCINLRSVTDAYGNPTAYRCLDYEGHAGRCQFAEPPARIQAQEIANLTYQQRKPEPWVSPLKES